MRLAQWEAEKSLIDFSEKETVRFKSSFHQKLTGERYALLINNHIERLRILSTGLNRWAQVNRDVLTSDGDGSTTIVEKIKLHQAKMNQVEGVIKSSLDGAIHNIKEELKKDIERFFKTRDSGVVRDTLSFIRQYDLPEREYDTLLKTTGFTHTLYRASQDFKQAVDRFIAEEVNPEIIRFIKEKEKRIGEHLHSVAAPYDVIIRDTLTEYDRAMGTFGITRLNDWSETVEFQEVDVVRSAMGLKIPISVAVLQYSAKVKTGATFRFGLYRTGRFLRQLLKKPVSDENTEGRRALADGLMRMKRETEEAVLSHFLDHKENIKFQYFFKLADGIGDSCYQMLLGRFQAYTSDLSRLADRINKNEIDREDSGNRLTAIAESSMKIGERISKIKETAIRRL